MSTSFVKLTNIPTNDDQIFDEIYIPIHEIHQISRIKNELLISYIGVYRISNFNAWLAVYSYKCESEEIAQQYISDILYELETFE